ETWYSGTSQRSKIMDETWRDPSWKSTRREGAKFTSWQAIPRFRAYDFPVYLDVGAGPWDTHASRIGRPRVTVDYLPPADLVGDYATLDTGRKWPAIWCSHTLEHILDPQSFIRKLFDDLELGGVLCLTVPRAHDEFIYSHVNLFTEGVLCYR